MGSAAKAPGTEPTRSLPRPGGCVVLVGMPVDPGNLMLLARLVQQHMKDVDAAEALKLELLA